MKIIFPRLFTVILSTLAAFGLIYPFHWSLPLTAGFLLLLNFIIILGATYFGAKGVVVFGIFSLLLVFLHSLRLSEFAIFPILLLVATTCIFYVYYLNLNRLARRTSIELDDIEEEKNILAVELEHLRLESTSFKQKQKKYTTLKALTETLSSTFSLDKTASLIAEETFKIISKSNACLLYLVDNERQQLYLAGAKTQSAVYEIKAKQGDMFDDWVFKRRTRLMIKDVNKDFRFDVHKHKVKDENLRGVRSLVSAPLIGANKVLGILRLDSGSCGVYDADDLRLLDIITDLACVAVQNTMFYKKTEELAIADGLTGLFVHRHFQERFDQEISRALWTNSQFAFLMLDIDNFKGYNDKYGHIVGDIILKQIAKLISSSVNPGDIVARYGGEEFAVLLVDANKTDALRTAERIKKRIEEEKFILRRELIRVSISGGITFFPDDEKEKEALIRRADSSLYKAKNMGKNIICTS